MAIQKRYNGDSNGIVNYDRSLGGELNGVAAPVAQIISSGIGKHISAFKITSSAVGADFAAQMGVGGAVETILRTVQLKATTIAYQVDGAQLSLIVEATGWGYESTGGVTAAADLEAALHAVGDRLLNDKYPVTAFDFTALTVSSAGGIKLA
jgi:hypothetical protein